MKDKLRELAKDLAEKEKDYAPFERRFSKELLAILDAEGDGGAVKEGCVVVPSRISEVEADIIGMPVRMYERAIEIASRIAKPVAYTHPARSGVVSDEDVEAARRAAYAYDTTAYDTTEQVCIDSESMRAALEAYERNRK